MSVFVESVTVPVTFERKVVGVAYLGPDRMPSSISLEQCDEATRQRIFANASKYDGVSISGHVKGKE